MRPRNPNRMPPVGTKHVVTIQAVARMLGWSTQRIQDVIPWLRNHSASQSVLRCPRPRLALFSSRASFAISVRTQARSCAKL
jgi:hypothetical protein